jgi:hypothetical protein
VPFFISLEGYEVRYRAGLGLFLTLSAFSYLNFTKVDIRGEAQFGTTDPRIVSVRKIFLAC